jgi:ABC-type Mn2+/Zn2+ transport system ATPase subunit
VRAEGLGVSFDGRPALEDVSFTLPAGAFAGVLGPNGAGKTTLLRALLGVLPHSGSAHLNGPAGYVPQLAAVASSFPVDALGVVLMGRYARLGWRRRPGATDRRLARELLERVDLADRARTPFGALSGGQRQRALVARALAQEGSVLVLDEPLTGIDSPSQETVLRVLAEQCGQGRTVLMSTHDLAQAARACDHLVVLDRGLVAAGPTQEVFRPDVLRRAYRTELLRLDGGVAVLDAGDHTHP